MDIFNLTIKEAVNLLKNKKISSKELVQICLENIKSKDDKINAVLTVNEDAITQAEYADQEISAESYDIKPLLGIPLILKDIYTTKGLRTTAGSRVLENYIPPYDATAVKKLKDAGAIIIGKANMDAWAHGSSGENSDFGNTANPYDLEYTPGGSSSGSAASVAAGMALASTGTDTGGSIRLPAAFTNLVGLKPTYGRVSRYGILAMGSSFDSIGHFTKNVYDSALILNVTAGKDSNDATTSSLEVPDYTSFLGKNIKGLKIGIIKEFFTEGLSTEINKSTQKAMETFKTLGAEIIEISLPHIDYAMATYYILVPAEVSSNLGRYDGVRFGNNRSAFGDEAKRRIMMGAYTLSAGYYDAYYKKALKVRTFIKNDFDNAFKDVDILLAPVSPTSPFKLGEKVNDPLSMYLSDIYVCPMNLAGVPALSIPIEPAYDLPVGMQLVAPQFKEDLLYQVAYAYEQQANHKFLQPKI